jgi:hypothetical protein
LGEWQVNGQWIGQYTSANNGLLVVNLDDDGDAYAGEVIAYGNSLAVPPPPLDPAAKPQTAEFIPVPPVIGRIRLRKGQQSWTETVTLVALERGTGRFLSPDEVGKVYPGAIAPVSVEVVIQRRERPSTTGPSVSLNVDWVSSLGQTGSAVLRCGSGDHPSTVQSVANVSNWADFKRWAIEELEPKRFVFRGQPVSKKLRTAFHRNGRASFLRFVTEDVATLHRHLTAFTDTYFDLNDRLHYAAFISLAQHHGYPTPLLDWTHSPFVAAYFAFRYLKPDQIKEDGRVRIFVFNSKFWNQQYEPATVLIPGFNYITFLEPLALNNPRSLPQQALSMISNVDDIEGYVRSRESERGQPVLRAIDLPVSERTRVLTELDLMGINPGSMFPGLDGACAQIKDRFFGY